MMSNTVSNKEMKIGQERRGLQTAHDDKSLKKYISGPGSPHNVEEIWNQHFHSKNASFVFYVNYTGENWKRNTHRLFQFFFVVVV